MLTDCRCFPKWVCVWVCVCLALVESIAVSVAREHASLSLIWSHYVPSEQKSEKMVHGKWFPLPCQWQSISGTILRRRTLFHQFQTNRNHSFARCTAPKLFTSKWDWNGRHRDKQAPHTGKSRTFHFAQNRNLQSKNWLKTSSWNTKVNISIPGNRCVLNGNTSRRPPTWIHDSLGLHNLYVWTRYFRVYVRILLLLFGSNFKIYRHFRMEAKYYKRF